MVHRNSVGCDIDSVYGLQDLEDDIQDYGVYADEVNIEFDQEELPDSEDEFNDHANERIKVKDLKERERKEIYEALLGLSNHAKLKKQHTYCCSKVQCKVTYSTTCLTKSKRMSCRWRIS
jgi:hypothetical protein